MYRSLHCCYKPTNRPDSPDEICTGTSLVASQKCEKRRNLVEHQKQHRSALFSNSLAHAVAIAEK